MFKKFTKQFRIRRYYLVSFTLAAIMLVASLALAQSVPVRAFNPGQPGAGMPENLNPQAASVVYLPVTINAWPPIPTVPLIDPIDNADQDNAFVVSWKNPGVGGTYILEESLDPSFPSPNVAYQGPPSPGKRLRGVSFRVFTISGSRPGPLTARAPGATFNPFASTRCSSGCRFAMMEWDICAAANMKILAGTRPFHWML